MTTMGNASRGTHGDALEASQIVYRTRQKLANLFGCPRADHVAFTSSGTEALNIAIRGTLWEPCHVIVMSNSACEIIDSINRDYQLAPITYDRIPDDTDWKNIHHTIAGKVRPDTKAIICSHDCSLTGNIFDLRQIGKLARDKHLHGRTVSDSCGRNLYRCALLFRPQIPDGTAGNRRTLYPPRRGNPSL